MDGDAPESGDRRPCPECGEPLPADARFCPHCRTVLDESAVDLSELDGLLDDADADAGSLLESSGDGFRRANRPIRVLSGLAVSVPLAPLILYLVGSVLDVTLWQAVGVFLAGWIGPAAYLARSPTPAMAFGRALHLVGFGTALVPVALSLSGGARTATGALSLEFGTVTAVTFVVAGASFALGTFIRNQARRTPVEEREVLKERQGG